MGPRYAVEEYTERDPTSRWNIPEFMNVLLNGICCPVDYSTTSREPYPPPIK